MQNHRTCIIFTNNIVSWNVIQINNFRGQIYLVSTNAKLFFVNWSPCTDRGNWQTFSAVLVEEGAGKSNPSSAGSTASHCNNKKAQLSLTNPRDAKACQKLLQFDVLTTLSLTILAYLQVHSFSCCCVRNLRNPTKFTENSNLWSSRSSKVIDLGVNRKPMYDFLLVTNSNFSHICYRFRDIDA